MYIQQLEPRATAFIPQMVETIEKIVANGHAYAAADGSGDVFFDVASLPGYGRLSGRQLEDNRAGERVAVDARKRGAADFALWKAAKPGALLCWLGAFFCGFVAAVWQLCGCCCAAVSAVSAAQNAALSSFLPIHSQHAPMAATTKTTKRAQPKTNATTTTAAGEPSWPSPWGPGRPGWHIECSAMIRAVMGPVIDVHGGGRDLVFPHHENELAQSQVRISNQRAAAAAAGDERSGFLSYSAVCSCQSFVYVVVVAARAAFRVLCLPARRAFVCCLWYKHTPNSAQTRANTQQKTTQRQPTNTQAAAGCCEKGHLHAGTDFVRLWMHNGFVNVDSEKMSKSLGNFFTIREVLKLYHPMALRWFLVATHYRAPVNYTQRALEEASDRVYYVLQSLADASAALAAAGDAGAAAAARAAEDAAAGRGEAGALARAAAEALLDDVNTPAVVGALSAPLKALNDLLTTKAGRKNPDRLPLIAGHAEGIRGAMALLGIVGGDGGNGNGAVDTALEELRALALARAGLTAAQVEERIAARAAARAAKDFAAADAVRQELAALGISIMDAPTGTTWRPGLREGALD